MCDVQCEPLAAKNENQQAYFRFTFEASLISLLMRWLVFFAKMAFICNVAFLLCLLIAFTGNFITNEMIKGAVIILGLVLSVFINAIVNITEIILAARRKPSPVRLWLRAFNFVVFALQIAHFFIYTNAQYL